MTRPSLLLPRTLHRHHNILELASPPPVEIADAGIANCDKAGRVVGTTLPAGAGNSHTLAGLDLKLLQLSAVVGGAAAFFGLVAVGVVSAAEERSREQREHLEEQLGQERARGEGRLREAAQETERLRDEVARLQRELHAARAAGRPTWAEPASVQAECEEEGPLGAALRAAALACERIGRPVEVTVLAADGK